MKRKEEDTGEAAAVRRVVVRTETVSDIVRRWCIVARHLTANKVDTLIHPLQAAISIGTFVDAVLVYENVHACARQQIVRLCEEARLEFNSAEFEARYGSMVAEAAKWNRLETVQYLLSRGASADVDPNACFGRSRMKRFQFPMKPPLHFAVGNGNAEMVRVLLDAGANVNLAFASDGATALHFAAVRNDATILRLLLDRGANVHARRRGHGGREDTPLHVAIRYKRSENVWALLDRGADVNFCDETTPTPALVLALQVGLDDADIEELIRRGADVQRGDANNGDTPLIDAAAYGRYIYEQRAKRGVLGSLVFFQGAEGERLDFRDIGGFTLA